MGIFFQAEIGLEIYMHWTGMRWYLYTWSKNDVISSFRKHYWALGLELGLGLGLGLGLELGLGLGLC